MDLSVIIVNYNVRAFLENALISVQKAMRNLQGEIFVVDNASDDGSSEMVQAKFPSVNLLANKKNFGFAKANNQALKQAQGKYLLLLNPDTVVQENTFEVLLKYFEQQKAELFALSCKYDNIIPFIMLDARENNILENLIWAKEHSFMGIKLYCRLGYYPNEIGRAHV